MSVIPAELTRLMNNVRVRLPGVLDDAIQIELFNVLDTFFQTTKAWQEDIKFNTKVGVTDYDLEPSEPAQIDGLLYVVDSNNIPVAAYMPTLETMRLKCAPSQVLTYTATVSLTVVDPTDRDGYPQVPDTIVKYYDCLRHGLLGEMMSQPAKPYSNERLGIFHMRKFRDKMASARAEIRRGYVYDGQAWQFPKTFV